VGDWDEFVAPAILHGTGFTTANVKRNLSDGHAMMLHVVGIDSAGNVSQRADAGPFYIDSAAPTLPTETATVPLVSTWSNIGTISFTHSGETDATSGVAGILAGWDTLPNANPVVKFSSAGNIASPRLADGKNIFMHWRTVDSPGNVSPVESDGPFFIDTHAPTGTTQINNGSSSTVDTVEIVRIVGRDATSGTDSSRIEMNGVITTVTMVNDSAIVSGSLRERGGDIFPGWHLVIVRIRDKAGNWSANIYDSIFYSPVEVIDQALQPRATALTVFPQPAQSVAMIVTPCSGSAQLTVSDAIGRIVIQKNVTGEQQTSALDVSVLPAGMYTCVLRGARVDVWGTLSVVK